MDHIIDMKETMKQILRQNEEMKGTLKELVAFRGEIHSTEVELSDNRFSVDFPIKSLNNFYFFEDQLK